MPRQPLERLTTVALHPGMHVHDETPAAPLHVIAGKQLLGNGQWLVTGDDGWSTVAGARHAWIAEPT